jgi:hypothetical protein
MRRRYKLVTLARGRHYWLAYTDDFGGIWQAHGLRWRLVARYPITDETREIALEHFAALEAGGTPLSAEEFAPHPSEATTWQLWRLPKVVVMAGVVVALIGMAAGIYFGVVRSSLAGHDRYASVPSVGTTSMPPSSAASTLPPVGTGYLSTDSGTVIFLQWNQHGDYLSGTAQEDSADGTPPNATVSVDTVEFTGEIHGSSISLSFDGSPMEFGTIASGHFTINFPDSQGDLVPVTFTAASASQFNQAVSTLHDNVRRANQVAANLQALQQAEQQISDDATAVQTDIASLADGETSLTGAVRSVLGALQQESTDLATTKQDEQKVQSEAAQGDQWQACYDAQQGVAYDASQGVAYDASLGVEFDANQDVAYQIDGLRHTIGVLQSDFAQFQADSSQVPGYVPTNAPTQAEVSQTVNGVGVAISAAIVTTNGYIDQANADVTTAFQYVAEAYQAGNCGTPPSAPEPQQHIS